MGWVAAIQEPELRALTPDLFFVELGNSFARLIRAGRLSHAEAQDHLELVRQLPMEVRPLADLATPALAMALSRQLTVYDACYAVLAELEDAVLVTADRRLADAVRRAELV